MDIARRERCTRAISILTLGSILSGQMPLPVAAQGESLALTPAAEAGAAAGRAMALAAEAPVECSQARIEPALGGTLRLEGVSVELPPGAVKESTIVSIRKLGAVEVLGEDIANVTAGARGYRFEPRGMRFEKGVTIRVPFDRGLLRSEAGLSNLYTYFYDEARCRWERLERAGIDREAAVVASTTTHFTDMIDGTLKLPEGPKPIQFDLNSIKSLEAANPCENVPDPEGPEPGAFGSNSFSIPLRLPEGRGGATPRLALRYSSDSSNGWLGRGFDIEAPAVTIDTRFGLPAYDGNDRYSLGGEELVKVGGGGATTFYRQRVEKGFRLIVWQRSGGEDYWRVTDKDGTLREYGRGEGWIGPNRGDRSRTFVWYLTKRRDAFGNAVGYDYYYDAENAYTYLSAIRYSSFESGGRTEEGIFRVDFVRQAREDRRSEARGCFPSKIAQRLSRIDVSASGSRVRSYLFDYGDYNEFGQSQLRSFSETDSSGATFYAYRFDYFALHPRNDGSGYPSYDGFGSRAENPVCESWNVGSEGKYDGLSSYMNASIEGSLSLGFAFYLPKFWHPGRRKKGELSIHGGIGASVGGSTGAFMDANADGLPDLVWRAGGSLFAYLNTGSGFDSSSEYRLGGLSSVMDKESSYNTSYGATASLGRLGGGITRQESWSSCETFFADVDGDGRPDFVKEGSRSYDYNTGSGFVSAQWRFGGEADPGESAESDDAACQAMYYLEEPTRAWEAWRSGTVEVEQSASLLDAGRQAQLALCTYAPGGQADAITLPGAGMAVAKAYAMGARERLFFRVDTEGDERNSGVSWRIRVRYTSIKLFESLASAVVFSPVKTTSDAGEIQGLAMLYDCKYGVYTLKADWQNYADDDTYSTLTHAGRFIARKIPASVFQRMLDAAIDAGDNKSSLVPDDDPTGSSQYQKLYLGYGYEAETGDFIRVKPADASDADVEAFLENNQAAIDAAFMAYVAISTISDAEREALASTKAVDRDDERVATKSSSGVSWYDRTSSPILHGADILPLERSSEATDGAIVQGKGYLIDTRTNPLTGKIEKLWLRTDSGAQIYSETDGAETELSTASPSLSGGEDSLDLGVSDYRLSRGFHFSAKSSLIASLSEDLYEGAVTDQVLAGKSFSSDSYWILPAAAWSAIDAALSDAPPAQDIPSDKAVFEASYIPNADGASYRLDPSVDGATLERLIHFVQASKNATTSPFYVLSGDSAQAMRLIKLDSDEYSGFINNEGADFGTDFALSADGSFHYPRRDLDDTELARLLVAMKRYCRDLQVFPYYAHDQARGVWRLRTDPALDDSQKKSVSDLMAACGQSVYASMSKSIRYSSDQSSEVSRTALPSGAKVEAIAPNGGREDQIGQDVGVALVPIVSSGGTTTIRPYYLHVYDSSADYSSVDLTYDSKVDRRAARNAYFQGGILGWYYGLWTGNYAWDASKLGTDPDQGGKNIDEGDVANPPYSSGVKANKQDGEDPLINLSGRDAPIAVPPAAWIGEVSSYSAATLSDDLMPTTIAYYFAAFMDGEHWYSCRHGGDSYYRMPNKDGAIGSGGSLSFIRESHSKGKDWNYPAGLSRNASDSWQYCGLMDLNGDRYPDLVKFRDAKGGASSFTVVGGNGQGFGSSRGYSLPGSGWLSKSETSAWCIGASSGAACGALSVENNSRGKLVRTEPQQDGSDSSSNSSFSLGAGINASFGSSVQTAGFYDLNGDGLPDYVYRGGTGAYGVALNCGDGTFRSVDWGSNCISVNAFEGVSGIGAIPLQGISHASTGSLGGNVTGGFWKASLTAGLSGSTTQTLSSLIDVNGDCLPDIVVKKPGEGFFRVRFNQGDKFADAESRIYRPEWPSEVDSYEFDASRELQQLLGGLNGIGLLGRDVSSSIPGFGRFSIPRFSDNPFLAAVNPFQVDDDLEYSTGASLNLGVNVSFGFDIFLLKWFIQPGVSGSVARTSVDLKFTDVDGDGLPDHLLKMPGATKVYVKRNLMGKAGLLKDMRLPQGGSYAFDYARVGNTVDMPQSRWVLSSLVKDDGAASLSADRGAHSYAESYSYASGYYDRAERMFFGFASVRAAKADGSVSTTTYLNRDYYTRGMASGSELAGPDPKGNQALYRESVSAVAKIAITGSLGKPIYFPAVTARVERQYEAGSSRFVETSLSYGYDAYGNAATFKDLGLSGDTGDDLVAEIRYADLPGYLKQLPESIRVSDAGGNLLRERRGSYGSSGELLTLEEYDGEGSFRRHSLSYDRYGNLSSVTDPRGYRISWQYDDAAHAFPVAIERGNPTSGSSTLSSSATWNYALGEKLSETDENGQSMRYAYDLFGRLVEIRSPYDSGNVAAVAHSYDLSSFPWTARTSNKLLYDPEDSRAMRTIVAIDGLGRILQTAKEGEYRDADATRHYGWNLSGAVAYDAKGRAIGEGQPQFAEGGAAPAIGAMVKPTTTSYDAQDRPLMKLLPDGAAVTTEYSVSGSLPIERSVDPLGNVSEKRQDGRGNILSLRRLSSTADVLMSASYSYDPLGEMLKAQDSKGNAVSLSYDLSGRRRSLESSDAGKILLSYDEAGNLAKKTDAVLRGRGEAITYEYDGLERLVKVKYPRSAATEYVFGEPGASKGGAGRLIQRRDASGRVRYEYGKLGETIAMTRTIDRLTPLADDLDARLEYRADYLGRMQRITYPDGEVLNYGYDSGGQLASAKSEHNGLATTYVADIAYDAFGQRSYIEYGNGLRTNYAYDEDRRWLSTIRTTGKLGAAYQDTSYRFDLAGNVLGYENVAASYETSQSYGYDGLYQLTSARGTSVYHPFGLAEYTSNYAQSFAYDAIGNMTRKKSSCLTSPSRAVGDDLNFDYAYSYYAGKAHQAEKIGNLYYRYDSNGNLIEEREGGHGSGDVLAGTVYSSGDLRMTDSGFGIVRQGSGSGGSGKTAYARNYAWDEENRLIRSADNSIAVDYRYGADGQRAAKYSRNGESLYFDSMWAVQADNPSLRQMKNVFVGQTRIATRLTLQGEATTGYERQNTYYYHPDHLGSAQLVTDYQGNEYERIEYTPYGESWIERAQDGLDLLPYKFTGKELDSETGLYYYGARYLNPKTSAWISPDPAIGDYIPLAPVDEEARKYNGNLPGMGGVFNLMNLALYHYAGNNPVKYTDPDGSHDVLGSLYKGFSSSVNFLTWGESLKAAECFDNGQWGLGVAHDVAGVAAGVFTLATLGGTGEASFGERTSVAAIGPARMALAKKIGNTIASSINADSTVVLGKYSGGAVGGYLKMADALNKSGISIKVFSLPALVYTAFEKLGIGRAVNMAWLGKVEDSGARILLNTDPNGELSGAFAEEVLSLKNAGFKFVETIINGMKCWEASHE